MVYNKKRIGVIRMVGKIISILYGLVKVRLAINIYTQDNIIGKNVTFDGPQKIIGEITGIDGNILHIKLIGEIINNKFIYGDIDKPSFASPCRFISREELDIIFNYDPNSNFIALGKSFIYDDYNINLNINSFFANHFSILGNNGSGKSYSVARIIQSIFYEAKSLPYKTNIFLFDAYGEYQRAFTEIGKVNENINYKVYTTDLANTEFERLNIPFWLLGVDDIALLLDVDSAVQIPVIEKALKLVYYFIKEEVVVIDQKNDIIARCILDIIFRGLTPSETHNKVVSILTKFNTSTLNLEIPLNKGGWTRTVRQCLYVDDSGKFADIELVITFLESFLVDDLELSLPDGSYAYGLEEFALALEFALLSEGILNSDKVYDYANVLKVRLNALINSEYSNYFKFPYYVTKDQYIKTLLTTSNHRKAQVVDFNINHVDDRFAKTLVKIYSKILFNYIVDMTPRASMPFHILLEEAHRYVQNDTDNSILGYNIFERISKEGRKYGILLGIISQRPSEISETVISQCSNFLIFKMFHPKDLQFVKDVIPNVSTTMLFRLKTLHPGTCMIFGDAFKMPLLVAMNKPYPEPLSNSCNIDNTWYVKNS